MRYPEYLPPDKDPGDDIVETLRRLKVLGKRLNPIRHRPRRTTRPSPTNVSATVKR